MYGINYCIGTVEVEIDETYQKDCEGLMEATTTPRDVVATGVVDS